MESTIRTVEIMREKALAVQTVFTTVAGLREAFSYAVEVTGSQGGKTLAAPGLGGEDRRELAALCEQRGISLVWENLRGHLGRIHTGFTVAQWGIAETGTVVLDSTSEDVRIASMLSETHIAVVPRSAVKPGAVDLAGELQEMMKRPGSYVAFISGASRTADIERVLTIGVHGPQEFHILISGENGA